MAPPRRPLKDRVLAKTESAPGDHLVWTGSMKRNKPNLSKVGNPVRVLLDLLPHPMIQVRPECLHPACINPSHWRVIKEVSAKYDDRPPPDWIDPRQQALIQGDFTPQQQAEITETIEALRSGDLTWDDVREFTDPSIVPEIERLCPP